MKNSNKLLIAFAAALILIPLIGMVYISRFEYKEGKYSDIVEQKMENFSTPTKNMTSIALDKPFGAVNVADALEGSIGIRFVKDEKYGIKIPTPYKDLVTAIIDANGTLQVRFKNQEESQRTRDYVSILVYAPNLKEVTVVNANATYLTATVDSIQFNVAKTGSVGIGAGSHINHLKVGATDVAALNLREDDVKSLNLSLSNANFKTEGNSFDQLTVATAGKCEVEIMGSYDQGKAYTIQNLNLTTLGKADVKLWGIKAVNCTGSFSDETTVAMPAANLNQMFKK